jgi:DNA polymerase-3 subunit gamma/tau
MEKFIVSARKYRPQNFNTVIGQKHITTTLKNAIANNTLAHAFLFCGPRGVGKTTCARILAKTINCENLQPDGEACNTCPSCDSFNRGSSLNIHELDAASNNSVDDIRDLVTQVRFAPQYGKYKIYIVDEVHMLSQQAFNAFLKTLEEPPAHAKFILATTEKHKILPTILSRCQIFDFKRITNADTVEHLQEIIELEKIGAEKSALQIIAQKSEGCMRDALSLLDKIVSFTGGKLSYQNTVEHLNLLDEDQYFNMLESLITQDIGGALLSYDAINARGFEGDMVLNGFAEVMRNLLISKDKKAAVLLDVLEGMADRYVEMASRVSVSYLVSALQVLSESELSYRMARNRRLHVEMALIKLCYLQQVIDLVVNGEGKVQQKRRMDVPVAVKEKPVEPLLLKTVAKASDASLTIQNQQVSSGDKQPAIAKKGKQVNLEPAQPQPKSAVLPTSPEPAAKISSSSPPPLPGKKSLLDNLKKEKIAQGDMFVEEKPVLPPNNEFVQSIWDKHIELLKGMDSKRTTVTSLQMAKFKIEGNHVRVLSNTKISQRFMEAEASDLLTALKDHCNNFEITLAFEVVENEDDLNKEVEPKYLSSAERFKKMAGEYPALLDLKEKLKLDLGY